MEIRQEMAREADYDIDLFCELVRSGVVKRERRRFSMGGMSAELTDGELPEDA